jgi:hypothetical protein
MATRRKAKPQKLKFELTKGAVGGIGVVTFCLFLWMFLLGVWAGQSLLRPTTAEKTVSAGAADLQSAPLVIRADKKAIKKTQ